MALFHFEMEDDIEEMLASSSTGAVAGGGFSGFVNLSDEVYSRVADFIEKNDVCIVDKDVIDVPYGGKYYDFKKIKAACKSDVRFHIIAENSALFYRADTSIEKIAEIMGFTTDEAGILRYLGLSGKSNARAKLITEEDEAECEYSKTKIGFVSADGFGIRTHHKGEYFLAGYDSPYSAYVEYDDIEIRENEDVWWWPVADDVCKWYCSEHIRYYYSLDEIEGLPEEDLSEATAAYTAEMEEKIRAGISEKGYYECSNEKEKVWAENFLPERYGRVRYKNWIVRDDGDLLKVAMLLGYKKEELCSDLSSYGISYDYYYPEKAGVKVCINKDSVKVIKTFAKDLFDGSCKGKLWHLKISNFSAAKADLLANIKKCSIDPYELTKFTTIWHYLVFVKALVKSLNYPELSINWSDTELSFLNYAYRYDPRDFKRNVIRAMRDYECREERLLKLLADVKAVAGKFGIWCRDPESCYKAAKDHANSVRR